MSIAELADAPGSVNESSQLLKLLKIEGNTDSVVGGREQVQKTFGFVRSARTTGANAAIATWTSFTAHEAGLSKGANKYPGI